MMALEEEEEATEEEVDMATEASSGVEVAMEVLDTDSPGGEEEGEEGGGAD